MSSSSSISETSESLSSGGNILVFHQYGSPLIPDCSGEYYLNGSGGGKSIYQRLDNMFMICWKETFGRWEIIEFATAQCWHRENLDIFGEFEPHGNTQGNPMVRED